MNAIKLTVRCNAFGKIETHSVMVEAGSVLVYDSIAGHYTRCHSLSASACQRICKLASK
jgi:hypothetical protein